MEKLSIFERGCGIATGDQSDLSRALGNRGALGNGKSFPGRLWCEPVRNSGPEKNGLGCSQAAGSGWS